jgi:uncharacterized membrane protein
VAVFFYGPSLVGQKSVSQKKHFITLYLSIFPYLCRPKKKDLFFTHFPQGSKSSQNFGAPAGSN